MNSDTTEAEFQHLVTSSSDDELLDIMTDPVERPRILRRIFEIWCAGESIPARRARWTR